MSLSGLPFDDILDLMATLPPIDNRAEKLAEERSESLCEVFGFGDQEAMLCAWLAGWSGKSPNIARPMIALFAGTHSVSQDTTADGSETNQDEETLAIVTRMAAGGAPVNQVCATHDIGLKVFDLALQYPVGDIRLEDALDEKGSAATIGFGMEAIAGGVDLLGLSAFGKGSIIANAALLSILGGQPVEVFLDHLAPHQAKAYAQSAKEAADRHRTAADDPLELLRRIGGREHSALLGAILAARVNHIPVVLDGMTALCVAALLERMNPETTRHCVVASDGNKAAYEAVLGEKTCVLSGFREGGDGSAAGSAIGVLKSLAAVHANTVIDAA